MWSSKMSQNSQILIQMEIEPNKGNKFLLFSISIGHNWDFSITKFFEWRITSSKKLKIWCAWVQIHFAWSPHISSYLTSVSKGQVQFQVCEPSQVLGSTMSQSVIIVKNDRVTAESVHPASQDGNQEDAYDKVFEYHTLRVCEKRNKNFVTQLLLCCSVYVFAQN